MFEQALKNIDDILHKDTGRANKLGYTEQFIRLYFSNDVTPLGVGGAAWSRDAGVAP